MMMMTDKGERSLGDLLAELSRETAQLVRKEVELATTEMTAKAKTAAVGTGIAVAGGALLYAGLLVLLAAIVIGLVQIGVTPWVAALLVALVTMTAGYLLVNKGRVRLKHTNVVPTQTIETLKETTTWRKRQGA
jgi:hypothetical protein